mmetsp:Transcript_27823/g.78332  ORF Transcript_27823/g.78332 Transcript_27823/m.78332 type:complete len:234 (+) Transcript_27823:87-788(+)
MANPPGHALTDGERRKEERARLTGTPRLRRCLKHCRLARPSRFYAPADLFGPRSRTCRGPRSPGSRPRTSPGTTPACRKRRGPCRIQARRCSATSARKATPRPGRRQSAPAIRCRGPSSAPRGPTSWIGVSYVPSSPSRAKFGARRWSCPQWGRRRSRCWRCCGSREKWRQKPPALQPGPANREAPKEAQPRAARPSSAEDIACHGRPTLIGPRPLHARARAHVRKCARPIEA